MVQQLHDISDTDVVAWHAVVAASVAHDLPGEPTPTPDQIRDQLTGRRLKWAARVDNAVAGVADLRLSGDDDLAEFGIHVHPAHRRRGIGSRLLTAVAEAARRESRRSLVAEASTSGVPFLEASGFACVLSLNLMLLKISDAEDVDDLVRAAHPGYRLVRWLGMVPDDLAETFAVAKSAMGDMPAAETWDTARVRDMALAVEKRGDTLLTVAALNGDTIAGFTELVIPAGEAVRAVQYDTAVIPGHRGNRLGLWVKAAMLHWLRADWPDVREIETDNAEDNTHMLAVNERLGFRPLRQTRQYQADPATIR
jgi:GNAT superfamily N-acetyltransferase